MSMPFYVSPEQAMRDKADYARKGIARGRSVVVLQYDEGILFMTENPSRSLYKTSEIHDRIAFAAVGRYNEFETLRQGGVRAADMQGYQYDRRDVTGRQLANLYAQTLGAIFTETPKPYEIEIVLAEVGDSFETDQLYRLTFDGSVGDEHGFVAMGGAAEQLTGALRERYREGMSLAEALAAGVDVLGQPQDGEHRELSAGQLEVAVLDRNRAKRKFRRIVGRRLEELLASGQLASLPTGAPGTGSGASAGDGSAEAESAGEEGGGSAAGENGGS